MLRPSFSRVKSKIVYVPIFVDVPDLRLPSEDIDRGNKIMRGQIELNVVVGALGHRGIKNEASALLTEVKRSNVFCRGGNWLGNAYDIGSLLPIAVKPQIREE